MDPDLPFVLAGVAVICITIVTIVRTVYGKSQGPSVRPAELDRIEERLTRIEQAIDAVALETERISEGQRFTTKLLADSPRVPAAEPARPPR
jgi:hypothetical protein